MSLRANSPSPRRNRMNLIEEYSEDDNEVASTTPQSNSDNSQTKAHPFLNKTAREIELSFDEAGKIPDTPYYELPPDFNEMTERKKIEQTLLEEKINSALNCFYREMNDTAAHHGLKQSNFAVAHGMHHYNNFSSALDIARLSNIALKKHSFLAEVVNTKELLVPSRAIQKHIYEWKNTNFMLWNQDGLGTYSGIKTGVTPTAGPCLSVCFKSKDGLFDFIVVVLNCSSREARFVEIPKLINWAMAKITKVKKSNLRPGVKRRLLRNMAHV